MEHLTADLTRALEGLEARPPFILVGHSWGGAIVRLFAAQHRELVAGMVLVDASHEATLGSSFISPAGRVLFWLMGRGTFLCLKMLALAGLGKLLARRSLGSRIFSKMTSEDRAQALWELSAASTYRTGRREVAHEHAGLQALARLPLPSVPVVAITGSKAPCFARKQRRFINDIYEKWTEALPNGEHVIAYRSGHLVPQSEPELVGRAIDSLIDRSTQ